MTKTQHSLLAAFFFILFLSGFWLTDNSPNIRFEPCKSLGIVTRKERISKNAEEYRSYGIYQTVSGSQLYYSLTPVEEFNFKPGAEVSCRIETPNNRANSLGIALIFIGFIGLGVSVLAVLILA